ncbi:MAG: PAS domain-containing protein [Armatimonadetes bacterium]|nr:PAS domain-containing protein [Armatimonadota bacterium]
MALNPVARAFEVPFGRIAGVGAVFAQWLDQLPAMAAWFDSQGRCLAANDALRTRLQADPVGRSLEDLLTEPDRGRLAPGLAAARAGERLSDLEVGLLGAHGRRLAAQMSTAPLPAALTVAGGFQAVFHDVADYASVQHEMEAYTHDLEQLYLRLERRSLELEQANEALHRARIEISEAEEVARLERLRTAFLDVAAHELRTPLTLINGILDYLKACETEAEPRALIETAGRSARRLGGIVDNALKLIQSNRPGFSARFKLCSLRHTLEAAVDDVRPFLDLRRQYLVLDLPEDLPRLVMDRSMVRDVAVNLLTNAIKFTPDYGRLELLAEQPDPHHLHFVVADNGVGIGAEDLPHVFDPGFASLDTTHHSSGVYEFNKRGPGIGLAIVRKFVDLHQGSVAVDTVPGRGTRFTVTLPLRRAATDHQSRS